MKAIKIIKYKCPICGELYDTEDEVDFCMYKDLKSKCIMSDWEKGYDLNYINWKYELHLELTEKQKNITKDSCFVIPYLQDSNLPCYKIIEIRKDGFFIIWGCGDWTGHKSFVVELNNLTDPRPIEEFKEY